MGSKMLSPFSVYLFHVIRIPPKANIKFFAVAKKIRTQIWLIVQCGINLNIDFKELLAIN